LVGSQPSPAQYLHSATASSVAGLLLLPLHIRTRDGFRTQVAGLPVGWGALGSTLALECRKTTTSPALAPSPSLPPTLALLRPRLLRLMMREVDDGMAMQRRLMHTNISSHVQVPAHGAL
jgi:hypothetical protein